ncbi:MAG: hypothetical protein HZA20_09465 [Nitrospirae bacterium]|nr:hypothetical protein [Nitrospirota bacterium]
MDSTADALRRRLTEAAVDGRISCARARRIAEELGVSYRDVGAAANGLGLKISACELGCF